MKILIACTVLVATCIAEPPVDNKYLPPNQGGNGYSQPSQTYGAPGRNTEAVFRGNPKGSNFNPRSSSRRPSSQYGPPPQGRTPSSSYGAPSGFGTPSNFGTPSTQYGAPSANLGTPSSQYGAPSANLGGANLGTPSSQYGAPSANLGSSNFGTPSSQYGVPSANFGSSNFGTPSSQYGAPSANLGSSNFGIPSSQYGAPSGQARQPSSQYGVPSFGARGNSRQSSRGQAPSSQYGAPSPSSVYGAPGFGNDGGDRGEQSRQYLPPGAGAGGRNGYGGDDDGSSEPANYSFEYMVKDEESGNDFGHRESRQGDRAEGLYYVLLPDGRKQTVEYEADQEGYRPRISYEDTGLGQGYDRNSQGQGIGGPY